MKEPPFQETYETVEGHQHTLSPTPATALLITWSAGALLLSWEEAACHSLANNSRSQLTKDGF
jgi:hypothetical protein